MGLGRLGALFFVMAAAALATGPAFPDEYPTRNVTFVVPFAPGGATDVVARLVSERLAASLGKPVIVENIAGAGGTVGTGRVAKAAPDGHTLLMGTIATHGIVPSLYQNLAYDAVGDFTAVTQAASQGYVIVIHPSLPVKDLGELIALAKQRPGQLTYASAGNGTAAHLFAELFKSMAEVDIKHVPYRGAGPAMNDLVGGHVSMTFDVLLTTLPQIQAGNVRPLAVTSGKRSAVLPDVPTLNEAGLKGYDAVGWNGVFVRAGTPAPIVDRLATEIRRILQDPEIRTKVSEQGAEVVASTPEEFAKFVREEIERWRAVVKATGVTMN